MHKPTGLQHHFVVIVNDDGSVETDSETLINLDGSDVYEPSAGLWYHHYEDDVSESYDKAEEIIINLIKMHNNPTL